MLYLTLFWTFFKIGLFTIGGGYAMLPLIEEEVVSHGWLTRERFIDFIGISEATPGAFAVNLATFVGVKTGGFFGAVLATLGLVLPSLIIIYLVAKVSGKALKKRTVQDAFSALRPAAVGLIFAAFISLFLQVILDVPRVYLLAAAKFDWRALVIFAVLFAVTKLPWRKKGVKIRVSPLIIILLGAVLGISMYI